MRRIQAILALLTLAALPLIPLAQASQMAGCTCKHMCACCMGHSTHSGDSRRGADHRTKTMYCERHADGQACCCGMVSPQHELRFVLAPLPPTVPSPLKVMAPPSCSPLAVAGATLRTAPGFSPDLFEPPRS